MTPSNTSAFNIANTVMKIFSVIYSTDVHPLTKQRKLNTERRHGSITLNGDVNTLIGDGDQSY